MRKTILIFLILTIRLSANAMCSSPELHVWPTQQNISSNSIFVIEGYNQSQELIRQLNKKCKIYLIGNSERIPVKVLKIVAGQFRLTQAILKPESELVKGKTYELHIDSLELFDQKDAYKVMKWTVNLADDNENPIWNCEPSYQGQSYTRFGCGPVMFVHFCSSFTDKSPTLIYAKVFNKKNKTSSDYFLTHTNQKISLGHGMCSGEFLFDQKSDYEVQFGLMDASGNQNFNLTEPKAFASPSEKNQSIEEFNCQCAEKSNLLIYSIFAIGIIGYGFVLYSIRKKTANKK